MEDKHLVFYSLENPLYFNEVQSHPQVSIHYSAFVGIGWQREGEHIYASFVRSSKLSVSLTDTRSSSYQAPISKLHPDANKAPRSPSDQVSF